MKVLVIQQKMIGDVLTSSILCEAIKQKHPSAELHYLVNSHTVPVVENNPFIDELVLFTSEMEQRKRVFYRFLKKIRKAKYDIVIDVYGKISSNLISYFSKAPKRISYHKKHTAFLYTHTLERLKKPVHNCSLAIENRLKLVEFLEIPFQEINPKIYLTQSEISSAEAYLTRSHISLKKPLFMISVLGSSEAKTYPLDYMASFLDSLVTENKEAQLLFNYIPKQEKEAREVYEHCLPITQECIFFSVFGKSLREFLAITSHCDAMLGNEGGAINMAKALQIPTFTIFSPSLKMQNWFGEKENKNHKAVHLQEFILYQEEDFVAAKKEPSKYYLKFTPSYIVQPLQDFIANLSL
ncbi:glycosyltransferase family 9 protein [Mesonia ostreae]|uniref:Glycosyltransferase family 9 protein n=1 Tax=Mesonia ostreae TaxID=861110 RepID=A0ABU2KGN8_9FLAO|nr:glycosyltransferase family 9 protein [Mesonia ostreae]MDT0293876.1 glycosyltransferase family 9 protein [Mesonia ostreae]